MRYGTTALLVLSLSGAAMAETVTVHRDQWGVPHVYADSEPGAAYGLGWAQAEDRLEQLLKNYRLAAGTMAEVFGQKWVKHDWQQRFVGHEAVSRRRYPELPAEVRAMIEAFQAGVRDYMAKHPDDVPAWAPTLAPWQVVALGRFIIFRWPMGRANAELKSRDEVRLPFSSNQWAVRPERTATGCAILCIDPHIPWHDEFRFYEFRAHAGRYHVSGFGAVGSPLVGLGHNAHLGWACTTGGPDTTDIYVEEINPKNRLQYRYDGQWRDIAVEKVRIKVKGRKPEVRTLQRSHHGPIMLREGNRAYALACPYLDEVDFTTQFYRMCLATNLAEFKAAVGMNQLMEQNLMAADDAGNIFYVRNGRVPIRPKGYDFSKPVPGNTSKTEWLGLHPLKDMVQLLNPARGYMQNCNTGPDTMLVDCPLKPDDYPSYIYNMAPQAWNPRSERAVELLEKADKMTLEQAIAIATDTRVGDVQRWQKVVADAVAAVADDDQAKQLQPALDLLSRWDGRLDLDSTGATLFRLLGEFGQEQEPRVDHKGISARRPQSADQQRSLVRALEAAQEYLLKRYGRLEVPWGQVHRICRGGKTWPMAGGGRALRAVGSSLEDGVFYGRSGQSWLQIVLFRKGAVESYSSTPYGQSDRPDSPHYTDQAAKLYSKKRLKPTWFQPKALQGHIESTTRLEWVR